MKKKKIIHLQKQVKKTTQQMREGERGLNSLKKKLLSLPVSEREKILNFAQAELKPIVKQNVYVSSDNSKVRKVHNSILLNGIKVKLENPDLDGDGVRGGEESIEKKFNKSMIPIKESSELGDAIKEQNKDIVTERLSSMDFASRIDRMEISPMIALDSLIGMGVIPVDCGKLNRVKMRKSVSLGGEGRREYVDLVTGKKEQDMKGGIGQGFKNFIGLGQKPEQSQQ